MKKSILSNLFFGVILFLFVIVNCGKDTKENKTNSLAVNSQKKLPTLLDFGAHNCIPCKKMMPILEELKKAYQRKINVKFIDVWKPKNKKLALSYGIRRIPTQIFLDAEGNELWRHEGFITKEDILKKWKEFGINF